MTTVARTIFDLATCVSPHQLERAFHEAEVQRLRDEVPLSTLLDRHPKRPGAPAIRALLASHRSFGVARSELEARFVAFLDRHGLSRPRLNAPLHARGRFFEVDCLWARERLIVELDGRAVHGTARAFERDRERDRILLAEGWRVMHVTWRQLHDEPEIISADLRGLLGAPSRSTL